MILWNILTWLYKSQSFSAFLKQHLDLCRISKVLSNLKSGILWRKLKTVVYCSTLLKSLFRQYCTLIYNELRSGLYGLYRNQFEHYLYMNLLWARKIFLFPCFSFLIFYFIGMSFLSHISPTVLIFFKLKKFFILLK